MSASGMMHGAALCLALTTLSTPQLNLDLKPATWSPAFFARPPTLAISDAGTIAYAMSDKRGSRLRILARAGKPSIIAMPRSDELQGILIGTNPRIESVVFDGENPVAAISAFFSGAYSGYDKATYAYRSGAWSYLPQLRVADANTWIVRSSANGFVLGRDSSRGVGLEQTIGHDQRASGTEIITARGRSIINAFVPLSATSSSIAGAMVLPTDRNAMPSATYDAIASYWRGGKVTRLGPGLLWASDGDTTFVGDDRAQYDIPGIPTIFRIGKRIRLGREAGSAFAINHVDAIVGAIGDDGFFFSNARGTTRIDRMLVDRSWHVSAAYAVSDTSEIIALASRRTASEPVLVKLVPTHASSCH